MNANTLTTHTIDIQDRIEEINDRLDEIEERKEEVKQEVAEAIGPDGGENDIPSDLEDDWDDLDDEEVDLTGELKKFQNVKKTWGNEEVDADGEGTGNYTCQWTVRELSFGQLQAVSDDMMEESFDVDVERGNVTGTPKQGYYQIELLREAIREGPPGAPTRTVKMGTVEREQPAPADYPFRIGEWLFDTVDAINTTGDTEMGNSSLSEAMKLSDSGRN